MTNKTDFIKRSSCGCNVGGQGTEQHPWSVHHCPMHEEASDMLEALKAILVGNTMQKANSWSLAEVIQQHYKIARAAIAKAEGKP